MWIIDNGNYEFRSLREFLEDYIKEIRSNNEISRLYVNNAYWQSAGGQEIFISADALRQLNNELEDFYIHECLDRRDSGGKPDGDGGWKW